MIVFGLDNCLWTPEMHKLLGPPSIPIGGPLDPNHPTTSTLGTIGMGFPSPQQKKRGGWGDAYITDEEVQLYPGTRLVLRELVRYPRYQTVKIAVGVTSLEPAYSQSCLEGIEIVEGVAVKDMISYAQIGWSGRLTSIKTTHFQLIHKESGIPYEDMLFFDNCNWGDHVGDLNRTFGVVGVMTPNGLSLEDFHHGLHQFTIEKRSRGSAGMRY